jgi:hypothetical protein
VQKAVFTELASTDLQGTLNLRIPLEDNRIGDQRWVGMWELFEQTSPELSDALEEEFRAALGDRRAKIARLWRSRRSNRNDHGS